MKTRTLDDFLYQLKGVYLCKEYDKYSKEVQEMVNNLFKATFRLNLYDGQIAYVLDEALKPFKKGGK